MARGLLVVAAAALVTAPAAFAHAILLHAEPPNGAILLTAPSVSDRGTQRSETTARTCSAACRAPLPETDS